MLMSLCKPTEKAQAIPPCAPNSQRDLRSTCPNSWRTGRKTPGPRGPIPSSVYWRLLHAPLRTPSAILSLCLSDSFKNSTWGVPWWPSGQDLELSLWRPGFDPWSGNHPTCHAAWPKYKKIIIKKNFFSKKKKLHMPPKGPGFDLSSATSWLCCQLRQPQCSPL